MKLTGNTILITGGGSGIGRGLAEALHQRKNQVIISGRRKDRLIEVAKANPGMAWVELNIEDPVNVSAVAAKVIAEYPGLNVLINNAGIMNIDDASVAIDEKLLVSTLTTNLMGPIRMTGALIEHLKRQPQAAVINTTSVLGFVPLAVTAVYSSTKAAMHSYTMSLRYKLKDTSVSVLEIAPPWVADGPAWQQQRTQGDAAFRIYRGDDESPRNRCRRGAGGAGQTAAECDGTPRGRVRDSIQ